ncbi:MULTISPECIES: YdiK family protein [Bacillaceae]|uniref:DUF4305 domain-containing protein n=1 Tax=Peribacillus huizhouensis TaxID=1501239 RepID=A0ABR6CWV3_9BACI|nr:MULTISPECIES: YdiK family protein [Bacillaceae]MBA9029173.1 hypothetical protein [Peribacillus huizhouensis]
MKRQSPLSIGIIYIALGVLFTVFAIQSVSSNGWGFFSYFLVGLATIDFGSGVRMLILHSKIKAIQKNKKK